MKKILWVTEGDVTGISLEILEKSKKEILALSNKRPIVLVQSQNVLSPSFGEKINLQDLKFIDKGFFIYRNNFLKISQEKKLLVGKPSKYSGGCAYHSLVSASLLQKKLGGDMLTLPLSKEWVIRFGMSSFIGHTEELSKLYNQKTFMLMYSQDLKVIPLTTHIPLNSVSSYIKNIDFLALFSAIKCSSLFKNPKIGVCGLNPHCGEGGKIGSEEKNYIIPLMKKWQKKGMNVSLPISADSIFTSEIKKNFDLILCWYHDQALIPFKALAGKKGVNVTLGLPFLRVSPDHGTAFDIAGKGIADPTSLKLAIKLFSL